MSVVRYDVSGGTGTVTLDSPDNRNALSAALRSELRAALEAAVADDAVRVIVLTHTGRVFCSGMDLKEASGAGAQSQGVRDVPALLQLIEEAPKPVVARVAGPARAGGLGLVGACDVAVASDDVTFALTEVRLGVVAAVVSVPLLPRLDPRAAAELFLTGEKFSAARAVEIGLLTRAVPAESLDSEVERFVSMLALGAPGALAATKRLLREARGGTGDYDAMLQLSASHFASEEGQEGIRAFLEKRPPRWVPGA